MRSRLAVLTVLVPLLLAGCGGDDDDGKASTTTTAPATTTTAQDVAKDKTLAEASVLQLKDLPTGWKGSPPEPDEPGDEGDFDKQMANCLKVDANLFKEDSPASADSLDFTGPKEEEASNSITIDATAAKAKEEFAIVEKAEMPGCLAQAITAELEASTRNPKPGEELPAGVKIGQAKVDKVSFPTYGERTVAYRMTVPITAPGVSINVNSDFVFALRSRALVMFFFNGEVGQVFPPDIATSLVKTVMDRLPAT